MRKILLILLSCIAASCLLLSACTVVTPNTSSEEEQGLIFNEGYLDVIELGEPISLDEYIDPYYVSDYSLILTSDETGEEFDLKTRWQWTTEYPGTFTLTYTVNEGEYAGTTISTKLQVIVPEISWQYTRGTYIYRAGTAINFGELQRSLNIAVKSYYAYEFSMDSVEFDGTKVDLAGLSEYVFPVEGTYTFNFSVTTEDGQSRSGSQKVTVRPEQVITAEGQEWLDDNNISVHDYKLVDGSGKVTLDAGYYSTSMYADSNIPYLAFNGNYGVGTYVMFDFTGKNIPQLAFFCKDVTNTIFDGKEGIYLQNGFTYNDGSTFSQHDQSRLTVFGPNKISFPEIDNRGRFEGCVIGSPTDPSPASFIALDPNCQYRYIVGFSAGSSTSATLRIILVNLTTLEREANYTLTLSKVSGIGDITYGKNFFSGSIVAYGRCGHDTTWDKVYEPITGITDIEELDVACSLKAGYKTQYALNSAVNVSDYIDDADGVYDFIVTDPEGNNVTVANDGSFTYTKSGTYRLYYDSKETSKRATSTTVDVTFDPKIDMGDDYFEKYGAIVAGSFGTGVKSQTDSKYIIEGSQSLQYYLNGANNNMVVGMSAKFLDFMFLARTLDSITFDVYAERDMKFKLHPTASGKTIVQQYEGEVPAKTWTTITITRELYNTNWEAYFNNAWRLAINFYTEKQMADKDAIYIDNIKLHAANYAETISDGAAAFMSANNITAYAYDTINDDLQVKLQPGWYQGNHYTVKSDDVPYVSYNGSYGDKSYIVMDFTGKNIPWVGFFMKETTSSLIDKRAGVLVGTGHTKLDGTQLSQTDNDRVTFYGPNKVDSKTAGGMRFDSDGRYSDQWKIEKGSKMPINALENGVHYRWIIGIKSATTGKVVIEALLINLDTGAKVDYQTKELTDTAFTADYLSGNIVLYGRYMKGITLDKIYPVYTNVSDIYSIDKVAEILG